MAQYNKVTAEVVEKLKAIAPNRVFAGEEINEDYIHDEMPIYGKFAPEAVVEAASTEEISEIMKVCNENCIPVIPRGAGTGLAGGAVAIEGGVVLCTTRMNKILEYDMENLSVRVQPGVLLQNLADDAATRGLLYPPDPGEKFATLGGNVSTNAGGMRAVKYGTTRDYVRAMTVVLPTGEIVKFGSNVKKTSTGYSLLNLMIGSEGTLGIITEITLKLVPAPKEIISLIVPFEDLNACIGAVPKVLLSGLNPQALEFMEKDIVRMSEKYLEKQVFPQVIDGVEAGAYLLISFDGDSMEELEQISEQASEILFEEGAIDILVADTPELKKNAWAARGSFLEAIQADTDELDECDVVVPISKIAEYLEYVNSLEEKHGLRIRSFGHAGDGNLHIYACRDGKPEAEWKEKCEAVMDDMYARANEIGGLVSGEHGIGHAKQEYLERCVGPVEMGIMQNIKKVFDPNLILNPGKVCYKL
ncbi:FAD-binding oxidoreductase [Lachnospiraceae bacterium NSJ-143]|nr:FAD-binding oxidoreductase [Lachnospiraceae bacterium NSJ-143]